MAQRTKEDSSFARHWTIPAQTRRTVLAVIFFVAGIFLFMAAFGLAGITGVDTFSLINRFMGLGYFIVPMICFLFGTTLLKEEPSGAAALKVLSSIVFFFAALGSVDMWSGRGGWLGHIISNMFVTWFDIYTGGIMLAALAGVALLVLIDGRISIAMLSAIFVPVWKAIRWVFTSIFSSIFKREPKIIDGQDELIEDSALTAKDAPTTEASSPQIADSSNYERNAVTVATEPIKNTPPKRSTAEELRALLGPYTPPPLSLLERDRGKAGVGDIKASGNIIKRTLQNFGIIVEIDEISVGPSVTRYAIKPAEGVRLSKIVALQQNLELALAAHPVRIEAPIPGKSLVGIEVPNSSKVTVGLGTMLAAPEFASSDKPLLIALGRDITGGSHFGNLAKMPHLLIAGATGSGKSVTIHTIITSLLYRNNPQTLRMIMIDPKRVELTLYNRIPHLLAPVITDPKRTITALRWAGKEMQRRYDILERERVRDITSYHATILKPALEKLREMEDNGEEDADFEVPEGMPFIVIVIDELADIMQSFPRELEAAIVRLAQMSRAVGIHLILSTQRPSVNVITGLIKANIPGRIALQVASQIDSRTIIDGAGAEKLLGAGDMLYLGGDGKPVRLQSAYIDEAEVKRVADYIAKHTEAELPVDFGGAQPGSISISEGGPAFSSSGNGGFSRDSFDDEGEEVDDDMYEAAKSAIIEAGKASTSYIQRRLKIGYSRAARIMDALEQRGVIGKGEGAKAREILVGNIPNTSVPTASAENMAHHEDDYDI